jgi:hypothetical protein
MPPAPATHRYERKFIPDSLTLPEVLALVRRHPALFHPTYPPRTVNNLYFDTPALRDYHDHVGGTACRAKTRIRWYGQADGPIPHPTLERKTKRGSVGGKHSFPLPPLTLDDHTPPCALAPALLGLADLADWPRLGLQSLQAVLVNRYRRHYFLSADHACRLTVDCQFHFFAPHRPLAAQTPVIAPEPRIVLELKYHPAHALRAAAIANTFPFRLGRCSKYVLGVDCLGRIHPG